MKRATYVLLMVLVVLSATPLAVAQAATLCGFGGSYVGLDGNSRTHRGLDIELAGDGRARSVVSGAVRFAGRIPSPDGGTVLAVSVICDSGTVTLMPLDGLAVSSGDEVVAGQDLGRASSTGDPSSPDPHLHLSLRRGDLYLDPSSLLAATTLDRPEPVVPEPEHVVEPKPQAAGEAAAAVAISARQGAQAPPAHVGGAVALSGAQGVPAASPSAISAGKAAGPSAVPVVAGEPLVGGVQPAVAPATPVDAVTQFSNGALSRWSADLSKLASSGITPRIQFAVCLALLMAAAATTLKRSSCSSLTSIKPVSDRLGMILQQLRTGDTLLGLNSCSGHTAFTVPEPFSPEEVKI